MKSEFIKTANVKNFITLTNNLINRGEGVPGMALVYGEPGLGKTKVATWWAANNDAIFVSAIQVSTPRSLLEEIVKEMGEVPLFRSSDLFNQVVKYLIKDPKVLIVDEVDYLTTDKRGIEILRDIHDRTHTPVILIGMRFAKRNLKKYTHLTDRFSEVLHFEPFSTKETDTLINGLSEINFTEDAIKYIHQAGFGFRQIVKFVDKAETIAEANDLKEIDLRCVTQLLRKESK